MMHQPVAALLGLAGKRLGSVGTRKELLFRHRLLMSPTVIPPGSLTLGSVSF